MKGRRRLKARTVKMGPEGSRGSNGNEDERGVCEKCEGSVSTIIQRGDERDNKRGNGDLY